MKKLILFLLFLANSLYSQGNLTVPLIDSTFLPTKEVIFDEKYIIEIDSAKKAIDSLMIAMKIPGLAIAVGGKNRVLWAEGFGFADLENFVPVTLESKFRVGSVSKVYTALAAAKLFELGMLQLDVPIQRYVPNYPNRKYIVTPRHLIHHTSGVRHYNYKTENEYLSRKQYRSVLEALEVFKNDSLLFEPNSQIEYTSYGYNLLSAVIEGAAGKRFIDYMQTEIFQQFDMTNTVPDHNDSIISNRVRFYTYSKDSSKHLNAYYVDNSNKWAGGGFLSNPLDMIKMCNKLTYSNILKNETKKLMFSKPKLKNGNNGYYGFAWGLETDSEGRQIALHSGTSIGGRSYLLLYPELKLSIGISANIRADFEKDFLFKIASIFLPRYSK